MRVGMGNGGGGANIFKRDAPSTFTSLNYFPMRWLQNVLVILRALGILPYLKVYSESYAKTNKRPT